jgi:hypothetical protein
MASRKRAACLRWIVDCGANHAEPHVEHAGVNFVEAAGHEQVYQAVRRERGGSVTNNSLAASQRPDISLIDRRHSDARRVRYRLCLNSKNMLGRKKAGRRVAS